MQFKDVCICVKKHQEAASPGRSGGSTGEEQLNDQSKIGALYDATNWAAITVEPITPSYRSLRPSKILDRTEKQMNRCPVFPEHHESRGAYKWANALE